TPDPAPSTSVDSRFPQNPAPDVPFPPGPGEPTVDSSPSFVPISFPPAAPVTSVPSYGKRSRATERERMSERDDDNEPTKRVKNRGNLKFNSLRKLTIRNSRNTSLRDVFAASPQLESLTFGPCHNVKLFPDNAPRTLSEMTLDALPADMQTVRQLGLSFPNLSSLTVVFEDPELVFGISSLTVVFVDPEVYTSV
ncbi:hypothetical protein KIPB_011674, partial [Kipferlia bialata]